jgi:hypothetical protein
VSERSAFGKWGATKSNPAKSAISERKALFLVSVDRRMGLEVREN